MKSKRPSRCLPRNPTESSHTKKGLHCLFTSSQNGVKSSHCRVVSPCNKIPLHRVSQPAIHVSVSSTTTHKKTRATINSSAAVFFPTTHTRDTAGHHYRRGSVHSERWARREDDTTTLVNTDFLWQFEKQNTRSPAVTPGLTSPLRSRFQHSFPSSVNVHNPLHVTA